MAKHRSSKPSGAQPSGANSDQDQPQHDPDPPYYREVALSDIPSQYAEEVDTFRRILSLPDPRESMPKSYLVRQRQQYVSGTSGGGTTTPRSFPSDQVSSERKEGGGGAHWLQSSSAPSLQESNPRV